MVFAISRLKHKAVLFTERNRMYTKGYDALVTEIAETRTKLLRLNRALANVEFHGGAMLVPSSDFVGIIDYANELYLHLIGLEYELAERSKRSNKLVKLGFKLQLVQLQWTVSLKKNGFMGMLCPTAFDAWDWIVGIGYEYAMKSVDEYFAHQQEVEQEDTDPTFSQIERNEKGFELG